MEKLHVGLKTRIEYVQLMIRFMVASYRMYYQNDTITSEFVDKRYCDAALKIYVRNDGTRAAIFIALDNLINERIFLEDDSIIIEFSDEHPCTNSEFSIFENNV